MKIRWIFGMAFLNITTYKLIDTILKPLNFLLIGMIEMIGNLKAFLTGCQMKFFHILFHDRGFLLEFNKLVSEAVYDSVFEKQLLTKKGTLKRARIPEWVKNAVFHRDKGRCVFCYQDLTRVFNHLTKSNFDHMVPLDLYGANDPCNIQLTCEHCNKSKSNKEPSTSTKYITWWKRD